MSFVYKLHHIVKAFIWQNRQNRTKNFFCHYFAFCRNVRQKSWFYKATFSVCFSPKNNRSPTRNGRINIAANPIKVFVVYNLTVIFCAVLAVLFKELLKVCREPFDELFLLVFVAENIVWGRAGLSCICELIKGKLPCRIRNVSRFVYNNRRLPPILFNIMC